MMRIDQARYVLPGIQGYNEPPGYQKEAFNCPHCNAFAHHYWVDCCIKILTQGTGIQHLDQLITIILRLCARCGQFSV